jgi:Protein of unknown function (DUF935)
MAENGVRDSGSGPPKGSVGDSPFAVSIPFDQLGKTIQEGVGGPPNVPPNDPAFQPPPPTGALVAPYATKVVYRDLPLITIQNCWTVQQVRAALASHMIGIFDLSGQLMDAVIGDDRVQATLGSRISGLFSREARHKPANDSDAAREVLDAWVAHWPQFCAAAPMVEMAAYAILGGLSHAQLLWPEDRDGLFKPCIRPWHIRYTYYHWPLRRHVAISQDGQIAIVPGDGKWMTYAPFGEYRGWIRGAIRAVSEPWLLRHFSFRDMGRFGEVHGMPIRKAKVPAASDEVARDLFAAQLANLGQETTLMVQTGVDGMGQDYDLSLVEATDTAWEVFPGMIDRCDMAIVLAIMFQNLTTEVKGGAFAATTAHMDIRQNGIQFDNAAWRSTIYNQVSRVFAFLNFGDADLAPTSEWDVTPTEDYQHNADQFAKFGQAIEVMARGGIKFTDVEALRSFAKRTFNLDGLPDFTIGDPPAASGGGFGK